MIIYWVRVRINPNPVYIHRVMFRVYLYPIQYMYIYCNIAEETNHDAAKDLDCSHECLR